MTYDEFKTFIVTHLWKQGDSVVINNLDTLVKTAETELDRKLKVEDRNVLYQFNAVGNGIDLPADCKSLVAVGSPGRGEMTYISQQHFFNANVKHQNATAGFYTVSNNALWLTGPINEDSRFPLIWAYYKKIPDFKADNASWVVDDYFDVYLYCVLKHSAPFLREDERVALWSGLYQDALDSALEANVDVKYAGSPMRMFSRGIA